MNHSLLPKIKLDPDNEKNRIITMYEGPSKEEADEMDLSLIDAYCRGYNVAVPFRIPGDAVISLRVSVKDVMIVVYEDDLNGGPPYYEVKLKGEVV